ncbi:carbohydrate kinase family protein [Candidatus Daviesbacteria bacterium]|nr:carbohydrate kinase family protein [Candidatus Daviesbacteria bacterium]
MITVTGSLAFDHIMDYPGRFSEHIMPDKIHQINLSFLVNTLSKQKGGTAGNIAYNLALLKIPVGVIGAVGVDFLEYAKFLQATGVDTTAIKTVENNLTSSAFIMTDKSDNQITAFYPGAMDYTDKLSLEETESDFAVISPNNPQAMINFCAQCQKTNTPFMLDPGMQLPALSAEDLQNMLKGATILVGNDYEIALLSDKLQVTSEKLLEQVNILITTLGEKGSLIQTKDQNIQIQAGKVSKAVDPTGAGDAYRGGFLAGYSKNLDLKVCGQMGSVAACFAVEKYGTTNHTFTLEQFAQRYKENFGEDLKL